MSSLRIRLPQARPCPPGATAIMRHYSEFQADLPAMLRAADLEPAELGFFHRANLVAQFLETRATLDTG